MIFLFCSEGYIIKIKFFFLLLLPENMSDHSIDADWTIFALIGFLLFGAIFIMIKLTVGSCYKYPDVKIKD